MCCSKKNSVDVLTLTAFFDVFPIWRLLAVTLGGAYRHLQLLNHSALVKLGCCVFGRLCRSDGFDYFLGNPASLPLLLDGEVTSISLDFLFNASRSP